MFLTSVVYIQIHTTSLLIEVHHMMTRPQTMVKTILCCLAGHRNSFHKNYKENLWQRAALAESISHRWTPVHTWVRSRAGPHPLLLITTTDGRTLLSETLAQIIPGRLRSMIPWNLEHILWASFLKRGTPPPVSPSRVTAPDLQECCRGL